MNNKLRRDLQDLLINNNVFNMPTAHTEGIIKRALEVLGGPVTDNRPQPITVVSSQVDGAPLIGCDPGDETAHNPTDAEKADLGRPADPLEYCP